MPLCYAERSLRIYIATKAVAPVAAGPLLDRFLLASLQLNAHGHQAP
jgi:hypothetical protein